MMDFSPSPYLYGMIFFFKLEGSFCPKCEDLSLPSLLSAVPPFQDDSSVSSEDMNSAEPTWVAAEQPPVPEPSPPNGDRVSNTTAAVKEEDGKTSLNVDTRPSCKSCHWLLSFLVLFTLEI